MLINFYIFASILFLFFSAVFR